MTRGSSRAQSKAQPRQSTRACDHCRFRKIKCERECVAQLAPSAPHQQDGRCMNCKQAKIACTFEKGAKPRGNTLRHAEYLVQKEQQLDEFFKATAAFIDREKLFGTHSETQKDVSTAHENVGRIRNNRANGNVPLPLRLVPLPLRSQSTSRLRKVPTSDQPQPSQPAINLSDWRNPASIANDSESDSSDDEGDSWPDNEYCNTTAPPLGEAEDKSLSVGVPRFHGGSSCFSLVSATRELRITGQTPLGMDYESEETIIKANKNAAELESKLGHKSKLKDPSGPSKDSLFLVFPPDDLLAKLVEIYFDQVNIILPLLHAPSFCKDIENQRHKFDACFGGVLLAVCAVASRYCHDRRVLAKVSKLKNVAPSAHSQAPLHPANIDSWVDDREQALRYELFEDAPWHSAGWKYYDRVDHFIRSDAHQLATLEAVKLSEVQTTYLLYQFHLGLGYYSRGWCMLGVAIRRAQDLGAHKKNRYAERSLEGELWKRALCCLIIADREAALCGRTGFSCSEYFDIENDLPIELDDGSFQNGQISVSPSQNLPRDKPSDIAAFNSHVKLSLLYELATTYLHPVDESKRPLNKIPGMFPAFDVVGHLEGAMVKWIEDLPPYLQTPTTQEDPIWKMQATILHIKHQLLRSYIYSAFLPENDVYNLRPGPRFPNDSVPTIRPTHSICSEKPTPSNARAMCAMSARLIAILLQGIGYTPNAAVPLSNQLYDAPSLISGAFFAGRCLQIVKTANIAITSQPEEATTKIEEETCFDDETRMNVCVDFLAKLQDRWASAETHRRSLRPAQDLLQGAVVSSQSPETAPTSRSVSQPAAWLPVPGQKTPPQEAQVATSQDYAAPEYHHASTETSQPLPQVRYLRQDSWELQSALGGPYYADNSSPKATSSRGSHGTKDPVSSPSPPSSESLESQYRDEPGIAWYNTTDNTGFKSSQSSRRTVRSISSESGDQVVLPQQDWIEPQITTYTLPTNPPANWKASHVPPYKVPTPSSSGYPVSVYEAPAPGVYPSGNHIPGDTSLTAPVGLDNAIGTHGALAPVEEFNGAAYPEYEYPLSETGQIYLQPYPNAYQYHQDASYTTH